MIRSLIVTLLIQHFALLSYSQTEEDFRKNFLTILVIPYVKSGESVTQFIEKEQMCRKVIGTVNNTFSERGYRVKDYQSILKLDKVAPEAIDLDRSVVKQAIKNSRVDIVIFAEIDVIKYAENERQLQISMKAIDQYSAESYASSVLIQSNRRAYSEKTIVNAVNDNQFMSSLEEFADKLDRTFVRLLKYGRTITLKLMLQEGSAKTFGSNVDNKEGDLASLIEAWVQANVNQIFSISGDEGYWQAECNLPLVSEENRQITPESFRGNFKKYMESLRVDDQLLEVPKYTVINSVIQLELK